MSPVKGHADQKKTNIIVALSEEGEGSQKKLCDRSRPKNLSSPSHVRIGGGERFIFARTRGSHRKDTRNKAIAI